MENNYNKHKKYEKIYTLLVILIFLSTSIVVVKAFYLGKKVDNYVDFFTVIEKKESTAIKVYNEKNEDLPISYIAADSLVNCIKSNIDYNNLPENITNIINKINNFYNESNNYFAFKYYDIYTGFTVSYNENQPIFAASTIKAPKDIYIWEKASQGDINLSDVLVYTKGYYSDGTGVLKNKSFNTEYNIRTLLNYSTVFSDNAAHNMLMDKYGRENILAFWQEKGTSTIFTSKTNWGNINASDAVIYMKELYNFYTTNNEYSQEAINNFFSSAPKFLKGKNNYKVASKSGWSGSAIHDVSIIFAENPYIVVALSNLGNTDSYSYYFNVVNDFANKLHTEYWQYKMELCNNIEQYKK